MLNKGNIFFSNIPAYLNLLISIALVGLLGAVDYLTGYEISFSIFYLIPVAYAAWYLRVRAGIVIAVISATTWFSIDYYYSGEEYTHPLIPVWNAFVRFGFFIIVTLLLDKLQKDIELQKSLAQIDGLTGLANGRTFKQQCAVHIELAARNQSALALAYIDLDGFKGVNDTFGHSTGDEVLKTVAKGIEYRLRKTDVGARLGGDEFAILLPQTDMQGARIFFNSLHKNLLEIMDQNNWPVGFSMGVAVFYSPTQNIDQAIHCADELMYKVKNSGKNRILFEEYGKVFDETKQLINSIKQ